MLIVVYFYYVIVGISKIIIVNSGIFDKVIMVFGIYFFFNYVVEFMFMWVIKLIVFYYEFVFI